MSARPALAKRPILTLADNCPNCEGRSWRVYGHDYTRGKGERELIVCTICDLTAKTPWHAPKEPSPDQQTGETS